MNCREIGEFGPLYLSGEMDKDQCARFEDHLAQCRSCASEVERQAALDARIQHVVAAAAELPDAAPLQRSVRRRIAAERVHRLATVAAAVVFAALLGYWALRPRPVPRLFTDAALDHRLEVMEHQPR